MKLSTIVSVSKRRRFTAEQWVSTFWMKHRRLVVRRDEGLLREWVITPSIDTFSVSSWKLPLPELVEVTCQRDDWMDSLSCRKVEGAFAFV